MLSPGILLDTQTGQTFSGNLAGPIAVQPSSAVSNGGTFQCHLQLQSQLKHQHQTSRYHQLERTTASASTRSSDNIFKTIPRHHRAHFSERPKLKRAVSYLVAQPCGCCHFRLQQSKLKLTAPLSPPPSSNKPPRLHALQPQPTQRRSADPVDVNIKLSLIAVRSVVG